MTRSLRPVAASFSRRGSISWTELIFLSVSRIGASFISASMRSGFVTIYAETYPLSICMPSTTSYERSMPCDSSTVTTPFLPTFSTVSAMMVPSSSLSAEMVATCWMSPLPSTGFAILASSLMAASRACSIPLRMPMAFAPRVSDARPSFTSASRSTTEVVVPSPAESLLLLATSFTISAPMFSNLLVKDISLAMDTPSLVMRGPP